MVSRSGPVLSAPVPTKRDQVLLVGMGAIRAEPLNRLLSVILEVIEDRDHQQVMGDFFMAISSSWIIIMVAPDKQILAAAFRRFRLVFQF